MGITFREALGQLLLEHMTDETTPLLGTLVGMTTALASAHGMPLAELQRVVGEVYAAAGETLPLDPVTFPPMQRPLRYDVLRGQLGLIPDDEGQWIRKADYDATADELASAKATIERIEAKLRPYL